MYSHGGVGRTCPFDGADLESVSTGASLGHRSVHFRHLGGDGPLCRCGDGDATSDYERRANTRKLLSKLAKRMGEARPADEPEFNPDIPAGYTYLGQLIAHDMVMSETSLANARINPELLRNHRTERLLLETVYGGGPEITPHVYALETYADTARITLRLGRAMHANLAERSGWPLRDIARVMSPDFDAAFGQDGVAPNAEAERLQERAFTNDAVYIGEKPKARTALIADPRNDDNLVISQLLVLFHIAHNVLANRLLADGTTLPDGDPRRLTARNRPRVFRVARKLLVRVWRRIIREDYLKRLLHPKVHAAYASGAQPWTCRFDDASDRRMPVEFSHGAFRMGHAMVRERYELSVFPDTDTAFESRLEELLNLTSSGTKPDFPLVSEWLIRWSKFFEFPSDMTTDTGAPLPTPQPSRRLRPTVAEAMTPMNLRGDGYGKGLPYRDLVSAVEMGVRTASSLADQIREVFGDDARDALGADSGHGLEAEIAAWLKNGVTDFREEEIAAIAADPPLPFYVLFEAEHRADGAHLGYLGSVILAETFAHALAGTEIYLEDDTIASHWEAQTGLDAVADIPGLCRFLLANRDLAEPYGFDIVPLV